MTKLEMEEKASTDLPPEVACTNRKWNVRSVAYQTLITQFQKLHPFSEQWNIYKNVICKIASESFPAIREQALEVVLSFVKSCGTAMETSKDVIRCLLDKVLASPTNQEAELLEEIILEYVEIGCSEQVIDQLLNAALDIEASGQCINIITNILSEFGPRQIDVKHILDVLPELRETDDEEFRSAIKAFVLELYRWRGHKSIANVGQILRPAEIKAVLREYDNKKPSKQLIPRRIIKQDNSENKPKKSDDDVPVTLDLLGKLDDNLFKKLDSHDWTERKDALLNIHKNLENLPKLIPGNYDPLLASLKRIITEDQCVIVVGYAITCITDIAKGLGHNFSPYAVAICRILLEKFVEKRQRITEQLREALDVITFTTTFESLIKTINIYLNNRNPTIRYETIQLVAKMFRKSNEQTLKKPEFNVLYKSLVTCLRHGQLIIREKSLIALGVALEIAGENIITPYLVNVDPITLKRMKNYKNEIDSFGEKYNKIRYRCYVAKKESPQIVEQITMVMHSDNASNNKTKDLINMKNSDERNDAAVCRNVDNTKLQVDNSFDTNKKAKRVNNRVNNKSVSISESSIERDINSFEMEPQNNKIESQSEHVITDKRKKNFIISSFKNRIDSDDKRGMFNTFKHEQSSANQTVKSTEDYTQPAHKSKKSTNLTSLRPEYAETESITEAPLQTDRRNKEDNNDENKKQMRRANSDSKLNLANDYNMKPPHQSTCILRNMGKCPEGFIILTESEVKKLLGLKKNPDMSDESTNDHQSRKKMLKRSYKKNHIQKELSDTGTQTNLVVNDAEADCSLSGPIGIEPGLIELPKIADVIPTQTSDVTLEEKGTNPCQLKRFNRGTQWVGQTDVGTEMHSQTLIVRTAEEALGPVSGSWSTVAWTSKELAKNWEHVSKKQEQCHHNEKSSPINLKSIILKKIEYREPSRKEDRKKIDSASTDPPSRAKLGRKETVEINTITLRRSNPFGKRLRNEHSKLQLVSVIPRRSEKKNRFYENRNCKSTQDDIDGEKAREAKCSVRKKSDSIKNSKTKTGRRKISKALESPNIISNANEIKANKRKSTREVTLQTSSHSSSEEEIHRDHFQSSDELQSLKYLKRNERVIRLRKVELSNQQLRSESMPNKNDFDKPLTKSFELKKRQISLVNVSRSMRIQTQNKQTNAKNSSKIKKYRLNESSSGSFKDGCSLFPIVPKDIFSNNESRGKKTSKNSSRQRVFKPRRYTRHKEINYKQISCHSNNNDKLTSKKCHCSPNGSRKNVPTKNYSQEGDRENVDPKTKELILSELLKVCDISQSTFEKMVRQKASRPCLFTPKAILQRVNELSRQPEQSDTLSTSEAKCESNKDMMKTCVIM